MNPRGVRHSTAAAALTLAIAAVVAACGSAEPTVILRVNVECTVNASLEGCVPLAPQRLALTKH